MSDHYIRVFYDQDCLRMEMLCRAASDAECRQTPQCNCEEWYGVYRDDGGWYHESGDEKHRHTPDGECGLLPWFDDALDELNAERQSFTVAEFDVTTTWTGDGCEWVKA